MPHQLRCWDIKQLTNKTQNETNKKKKEKERNKEKMEKEEKRKKEEEKEGKETRDSLIMQEESGKMKRGSGRRAVDRRVIQSRC